MVSDVTLTHWYTCTYSDGDWDFYWCDREWLAQNYDTMFLYEHQKILHFRNHYEVIAPEATGGDDWAIATIPSLKFKITPYLCILVFT